MADWAGILGSGRDLIEATGVPEAARFLVDWPMPAAVRGVTPASLEVLRWLRASATRAPAGPVGRFACAIADAAGELCWRQSYRTGDVPRTFLERYGWCELFGRCGPIPCTALAGGVLLLGPDTHYPSHQHAAEELYVPLSGDADWQRGHGDFEARRPGDGIFHARGEPHAMRTATAPLLALYLWRGEGLDERATLAIDRVTR